MSTIDATEYGLKTQESPPADAMMDRMGNLVPPHDIGAEACVLGSMLIDADAVVPLVRRALTPEDFYRPAHGDIFRLVLDMADARKPVDLVLVRNELHQRKQLEQVGGIEYVVALAEGVPSTANAEYYANIVRDKSLLRKAIQAARQIEREAYGAFGVRDSASEVLGRAQQAFYDLARPMENENEASLGPEARKKLADMEAEQEHGRPSERRVSCGFPVIDQAIHGLRAGRMVTLAAKTKAGKSTLALNMALHVAFQGEPVLYISGEMRTNELADRFLSMHAPIHGDSLKNPRSLRMEDWEKLRRTAEAFDPLPLRMVGRGLSLAEIGMKARETGTMFGKQTALVVVDYLALMKLPPAREARIRVGEFTRGLKQLAMELGCGILLVSQIRRLAEENAKPQLHDLKESGDIENDSDAVLLIHTPDGDRHWTTSHDGKQARESWVKIAACRDGTITHWPKDGSDAPGAIRLRYRPWNMLFEAW